MTIMRYYARILALRAALAAVIAGLLAGCGEPPQPPVWVLFIGNSYTSEHNLPRLFADLAAAGGHPAEVSLVAWGGATLAGHLAKGDAADQIAAQPWDYVVLQEQSVLPALADQRTTEMYPAVRRLARLAREAGAQPVLLLTWGRRDGLRDGGFAGFGPMQDQLTRGYLGIADELGAPVAPAGEAWRRAIVESPTVALWQADGSHPSLAGSYLAACVLYAATFGESPAGLPAPRGIAPEEAAWLQEIAAAVTFGDRERWNLEEDRS